jgi:hypothetical protein
MGDSVWEELWSRLCHQGTVYSASFAALPSLEAAARRWPAEHRLPALALGASIVAATDVEGRREEFLRGFEETVARLGQLALETIARPFGLVRSTSTCSRLRSRSKEIRSGDDSWRAS